MEKYESSPLVKKIVRNIMERKDPEPPKARNPVAKNANAAVGGGAAGKHKDRKKDAKQGVQKHKGQQLDEYFEKEKPTDGELLLLMKKYRLAKISGKPLASVMRQSDIHKLIDAEKDGRIEALKYKDSIDERYDDEDDQGYTNKSDFKRHELEHELGHETRSGAVYIDGKYWKTFDTYKQAQNVARSLERKGKNAVARMLESKKPKKTAQEKLNAAVDRERKKNEPATKRAKQELDAAMPSKALAEGKVCPQCGSSKCSCPPGKCKCKPVAGFKPKMSEDKDPCWKNYKMVGTKKKGSKTVPNCVPKESRVGEAQNAAQQAAIAIAKKKKKGVAEGKVKLYTDPSYFGAEVDDTGFDNLPIVNISANQLVGFEPDAKMNQPKSRANVEKIVAGLKQDAKLPPLLVRKYKNGYQVLDGHHRFWAYKLLGVKSIPSRIVPDEDIEEISKQGVAEGGEKYKIKSTGSDINPATGKRETFYISPSTGKKVYKVDVNKGDHENPKTGEHKPKLEGRFARAIMKEFELK
jgi:hypothetical protein